MAPKVRSLPSKSHSCSELQKGHQKLMSVKREADEPDEFAQKIKECEDQIKALKEKHQEQADGTEETQPATEEELLAAGRRTPAVPKARSTAKAKAKKPTGAPQSAPTGVVKTIEKKTLKGKVVPHTVVKGTQEPSAASQPPSKRLRGKTAETPNVEEPDQAAALAKTNADLMAELAKLKDELAKQKKAKKLSPPTATPPGRRVRAPSPASKSVDEEEEDNEEDTEYPQTDVGAGFGGESEEDEPGSEAAKNNRLRRLCEIKPSGRCHVPEDVHLRWKKGGAERMALRDELESCGWDKDKFVTTLTRQREKLSKVTRTKKRGWYTKEKMRTKLGWSKKYIDDVVKYCEKKGNESLIRKDKYNRSISKYHVDVDEDDDEVSEDLEREVKVSCKDVKNPVKFKSLKPKRTREDLAPKHRDESDDDDDEPNDAEPVTGVQEYIALKKFGDSLLSKNKKLSDLSGQLDEAMAASDETSPHQDRVTKSQQNLEHAMQILETEFEAVEQTKAEVSGLQNGKLSELAAKALICKVEEQIKKSQRACAKVVTAEATAKNVLKMLWK